MTINWVNKKVSVMAGHRSRLNTGVYEVRQSIAFNSTAFNSTTLGIFLGIFLTNLAKNLHILFNYTCWLMMALMAPVIILNDGPVILYLIAVGGLIGVLLYFCVLFISLIRRK